MDGVQLNIRQGIRCKLFYYLKSFETFKADHKLCCKKNLWLLSVLGKVLECLSIAN